ncbi:MAG: kynureninase [Candidatus Hodarchaeales archaeon]|jgi:kynureninase
MAENDENLALELDANDELKIYRDQFHIPKVNGKEAIYFNGNSLGLQQKNVAKLVNQEINDWQTYGVEGHFKSATPWADYHETLTKSLATVVGAKPIEVTTMNTLSVNLHILFVSFYRPTKERNKILIEYSAFPSDQYAIKSQIKFHGFDPKECLIELKPRPGEEIIHAEDIARVIEQEGEEIALIWIGNPNYYTGQVYDVEKITRLGHSKGCIVGFDFAHGIGNLVLQLHNWDVDIAVWCTYKYLNGGPGSISGCFVNERHATADLPRFAGWWGHNKERRFLMEPDFDAIPGAEGWHISNPPLLSMIPVKASLELFVEIGMERLRKKSVQMTEFLFSLLDKLPEGAINVITPRDPGQRGSQLSIMFTSNGKTIHQKLIEYGVICDWREPNVIRIAPTPLYNTYHECYRFVEIIKSQILAS